METSVPDFYLHSTGGVKRVKYHPTVPGSSPSSMGLEGELPVWDAELRRYDFQGNHEPHNVAARPKCKLRHRTRQQRCFSSRPPLRSIDCSTIFIMTLSSSTINAYRGDFKGTPRNMIAREDPAIDCFYPSTPMPWVFPFPVEIRHGPQSFHGIPGKSYSPYLFHWMAPQSW